ncbi:MAG: peptidoglycan-binding protein, partial [bacterium]
QPQIANDPGSAGLILAQFLKHREAAIRAAMAAHQLAKARRLVNGGSHGLDRFVETYEKAMALLPA